MSTFYDLFTKGRRKTPLLSSPLQWELGENPKHSGAFSACAAYAGHATRPRLRLRTRDVRPEDKLSQQGFDEHLLVEICLSSTSFWGDLFSVFFLFLNGQQSYMLHISVVLKQLMSARSVLAAQEPTPSFSRRAVGVGSAHPDEGRRYEAQHTRTHP